MSTLQRVTGQRDWESKYGTMTSVGLDFGEFQAELNTKPETVVRRLEMCEAWIGKESDGWAFEDKGNFDNGNPKPKKVLSYPGKVVQGSGMSPGSAGTPARGRSPELEQYIQERMDRRTALMQAVEYYKPMSEVSRATALIAADDFYSWLRETSGTGVSPAPGETLLSPPVPEPTFPAAKTVGEGSEAPEARRGDRTGSRSTRPSVQASTSPAGASTATEAHSGEVQSTVADEPLVAGVRAGEVPAPAAGGCKACGSESSRPGRTGWLVCNDCGQARRP